MPSEESGKYGDLRPENFRMDAESEDDELKDSDSTIEIKRPVDHEITKNSEKRDDVETRISPEEYLEALERVLTGPERNRCLEKLEKVLDEIRKLEGDKKKEAIAVLTETIGILKQTADNLKEFYEQVEETLDAVIETVEVKK